jgi:hypothetical protein
MYADLNNNGEEDSYEPYESVSVDWYKRVHLSGTSSPVNGALSAYVSATLLHANSSPYTGNYEWWIDSGSHTTQSTSNGYGYISIPAQSPGAHQVHVQFTDTDGTQSNTYDITWAAAAQALSLTSDIPLVNGSRNASTGATAHVTMTLKNADNSVAAGQVMRYEIYGANDDSGKRAVTTGSNGQATISWTGVTAGSDTVHVWPDYDGNGQANGSELDVDQYLYVTFHDRVELTPGYSDAKYEGNTESVTLKFRIDLYQPLAS